MPVHTLMRLYVSAEQQVRSFQCNVCGKEESCPEGRPRPKDMFVIQLSGGWGDEYPGDSEEVSFVVHGHCLRAWTTTFQIPPEHRDTTLAPPVLCTHSETGKTLILQGGWLHEGDCPKRMLNEDFEQIPFSECLPEPGIYEHFKGALYRVISPGWDAHAPHDAHVIYQALYGEFKIWARPARMWSEEVQHGNYKGPRFLLKYPQDRHPLKFKL